MTQHEIIIKTQSFNLRVQQIEQSVWFHFKGRTFVLPAKKIVKTPLPTKPHQGSAFPQAFKESTKKQTKQMTILSPMPGKISKIFVKNGSFVKKNQSLLALSAMKMEYSVKAPFKAKVLKVNVKEGDIVAMDQVLIHLVHLV